MALKLDRFQAGKEVEKARSEEQAKGEFRRRDDAAEKQAALKQSLVGKLPHSARHPVVEKSRGTPFDRAQGERSKGPETRLSQQGRVAEQREAKFRETVRNYHQLIQPKVIQPTGAQPAVVTNPFSKNGAPIIQLPHQQTNAPQVRAAVQQAAIHPAVDRPAIHEPKQPTDGALAKNSKGPQPTDQPKFVAAMANVAGAKINTQTDRGSSIADRKSEAEDDTEEGKPKTESKRGGAAVGRGSVYRGPLDELTGGMGNMGGGSDGDSPYAPLTPNPNLPESIYKKFYGVMSVNGTERENELYEVVWRYQKYVEKPLNKYAQLLKNIDDKELGKIFPDPASRRVVLAAAGEDGEGLRKTVLQEYNARSNVYGGRHV